MKCLSFWIPLFQRLQLLFTRETSRASPYLGDGENSLRRQDSEAKHPLSSGTEPIAAGVELKVFRGMQVRSRSEGNVWLAEEQESSHRVTDIAIARLQEIFFRPIHTILPQKLGS